MNYVDAVRNTPVEARTENGMKALRSTLRATTDLFYNIGASRGKDIIPQFESAYQENAEAALRIALYGRDVRGGAGERQLFRNILQHLEMQHPEVLLQTNILERIPELGRYDDLLVFQTEAVKHRAYDVLKAALDAGHGLAAKWLPRKHALAAELRDYFGWTPKYYRKRLVELTKVVETQMCAKDWEAIDFNKVPSLAMTRYQKAFAKNAAANFQLYKDALKKGDPKVAKVNAGAVYPYDVIRGLRKGGPNTAVADAQWAALPDYFNGQEAKTLPLVDVSGSMEYPIGGEYKGTGYVTTNMDVAVSLGLYLSEKNRGPFKDLFLSFTAAPVFHYLTGTLAQRIYQMVTSDWGMNTNLHAAFDEILRVAVKNSVAAEDMPATLLILSDMQFDACITWDDSAIEMIKRKYEEAGYQVPNVVFWNLRATGNTPVKHNAKGVALVSGFSPSIMAAILGADPDEFTPEAVMLKAIMVDRYDLQLVG